MLYIDKNKCIGCGQCQKDCWFGAISMQSGKADVNFSACFKCGHCVAICPKNCFSLDDYGDIPILEHNPAEFDIEANKLLNFIKFRRTIRQFLPKQVERATIENILQAGRFTQTAGNQQNVAYIVVQDKLQELRKMAIDKLYALSKELTGTADPILKRYAGLWTLMYREYRNNPAGNDKLFLKAPMLILVTSPSTINAGLASANIANMIDATPNMGTCFSGFFVCAAAADKNFHEFLGVQANHEIISCLLVGYHNTKYYRTVPRKPANITWL